MVLLVGWFNIRPVVLTLVWILTLAWFQVLDGYHIMNFLLWRQCQALMEVTIWRNRLLEVLEQEGPLATTIPTINLVMKELLDFQTACLKAFSVVLTSALEYPRTATILQQQLWSM
ncbi:hypothetical protein N7540_012230 [Penicillium herquei]|nr:hypothetical protein N7540_012230 [Penicillium herquei]